MLEIEKKYLLKTMPTELIIGVLPNEIEQGYISYNPEIRIRRYNDKYFITEKSEGTLIREEKEIEISKKVYDILSNLIKDNIIKKTRYNILLTSGYVAELNIYHDNLEGLNVIEVEFETEKEAKLFIPPSWFGKEVTSDETYKNKNLVKIKDK